VTSFERHEEAAYAAVETEIEAARQSLASRGLTAGTLEAHRGGEGDSYLSELRLYVFRGGQICDALEVHMVRGAKPVATVDELRDWFRTELAGLV
jgi:hypothetical protein